jgi:hypothetical protein
MLNYLEKKYAEKFVMKSFLPGGNGFNKPAYDEGWVYPKNNISKSFKIQRYKSKDDDGHYFTDGYGLRIAEEQFSQKITDIAQEFFDNYELSVKISTPAPESTDYSFDKSFNLEDFFEKEPRSLNNVVRLYIGSKEVIDIQDQSEKVYGFMNKVLEDGYYAFVVFIFVDEDNYSKVEPEKLVNNELKDIIEHLNVKYRTYSEIKRGLSFTDSVQDIVSRFGNH